MFKLMQRLMTATTLLIGLSGCYPESLLTAETKVNLPVAKKYQVIWDRLPKRSPENLLGTLFHITPRQDGGYSLKYKYRRKNEHKIVDTMKVGDSFYIQLQDGDAFELMRLEFHGDEVVLYSEIAGCAIKNGDDKYPDNNMLRLDSRNCIPALGVSPTEMEVTDGVGRIHLLGGAAQAIEFLQRYGSKMYAERKYRLKVQ